EWNYGKPPAFRVRRAGETAGVLPAAVIDVEGGRIGALHFETTPEKPGRAVQLETRLVGAAYHRQAICACLSGVDLSGFGPRVTAGQVAQHLCDLVAGGPGPGLQTA
ncbi:MAG: lipoate protein ligase C-terminal domain-containing protein, partial [Desulfobacterales bacterium]